LPDLLLPAVWAAYIGDATNRLDVAASASKASTALLALAPLCGKQVQPLTGAAKAISEILNPKGLEAFSRLQRRSEHASCDLWQLLWREGAAAWEDCVKQSFAAGMSLDLEEATVKYQVKLEAANRHQQQLVEHQWNAASHGKKHNLCYHWRSILSNCYNNPKPLACNIQLCCIKRPIGCLHTHNNCLHLHPSYLHSWCMSTRFLWHLAGTYAFQLTAWELLSA
jgi:hypothetical protein